MVFFSPKRSEVWRNFLWAHLLVSEPIHFFVMLLAICLVKCFHAAMFQNLIIRLKKEIKQRRPILLTHDEVETLKSVTSIAISWCLSKSSHTTFAELLSKISLILCQGWLLSLNEEIRSLTCTSFGELHAINKCWRR